MSTNTKARIFIVEDHPLIAEDLKESIREFGHEPVGIASNADEAMKLIGEKEVDLVIIDVGLDGAIDGIQLAGLIKEKYHLPFIFLTALYDEQIIQRIRSTMPEAYLVKPIVEHTLRTTLEVVWYNLQYKHEEQKEDIGGSEIHGEHFFIKVKNGLQKIRLQEILFFEAYDNYAYVYTDQAKILMGISLKLIEERLPGVPFVRSHRSYIVNIDKIERIEETYIMIAGHQVPIGKTHRAELMRNIQML